MGQQVQLLEMKAIFVLVLVACFAFDLCNANKKRKKMFRKPMDGDDYQLLGGMLGDPELIKSLIPKNMGELFDLDEEIVPGMKDLPDVAEKVSPTLIEIRKALQADGDISDEQFGKWGKALVQDGRPFAKKAIDNFIEAPLEEIINKLESTGVVDKIKEFLGEEHKKMLDEAIGWCKKIVAVVLKIKNA